MPRQSFEPQPTGMSQATRAGNVITLSGQVAFNADGELVGEGDAAAQSEQIFLNIERLLGKAGASLDDVILLRCYLTSADHFNEYLKAKMRRFPSEGPAGTSVIVAGLLDPRFLMEVEVVALVG